MPASPPSGAAIVGATARRPAGLNDIIVVVLGIVIYLALGFAFHPIVIGVPVFGR